jgi:hypothetical protein
MQFRIFYTGKSGVKRDDKALFGKHMHERTSNETLTREIPVNLMEQGRQKPDT